MARSRSLFVATPPLILALLDKGSNFEESERRYRFEKELKPNLGFYLTGQVVAAYLPVRLTPQDFGSPRERDFAKLNLHLGIFEQPMKINFFCNLFDDRVTLGHPLGVGFVAV